jgi:hypothetical protein
MNAMVRGIKNVDLNRRVDVGPPFRIRLLKHWACGAATRGNPAIAVRWSK